MSEIETSLVEAARQVRKETYAPYSGYWVGAAILDSHGRVWTGVNVENISFGATLCAERVAIGKMVSAGSRQIEMLALVTADAGTPCGICLQTLSEFSKNPSSMRVLMADDSSQIREYSLAELLPHGFNSTKVARTEP